MLYQFSGAWSDLESTCHWPRFVWSVIITNWCLGNRIDHGNSSFQLEITEHGKCSSCNDQLALIDLSSLISDSWKIDRKHKERIPYWLDEAIVLVNWTSWEISLEVFFSMNNPIISHLLSDISLNCCLNFSQCTQKACLQFAFTLSWIFFFLFLRNMFHVFPAVWHVHQSGTRLEGTDSQKAGFPCLALAFLSFPFALYFLLQRCNAEVLGNPLDKLIEVWQSWAVDNDN